jgi:hypothetical protein
VRFIGVGESGARNFAAKAHVIELGPDGAQTSLNVAKAFTISELRER